MYEEGRTGGGRRREGEEGGREGEREYGMRGKKGEGINGERRGERKKKEGRMRGEEM